MKRILSLLALAVLVLVAITAFTFAQGTSSSEITTRDIGAKMDSQMGNSLSTATFTPHLSSTEVTAKAITYLKERNNWDAIEMDLPIDATVGLYTGIVEDQDRFVTDHEVWVVVFRNVPISYRGPKPKSGVYPTEKRYTMVIDHETGEFIHSTLWMGYVK